MRTIAGGAVATRHLVQGHRRPNLHLRRGRLLGRREVLLRDRETTGRSQNNDECLLMQFFHRHLPWQ